MDYQEGRKCLYEVLNVDRFCKEDDIKKAYKKQALINHPDKAPKGEEENYKEKFQTINDAYQVLSNPQERAWYDAHRDEYLNPHKKDKNYQGFTFNIKDYLIEENLEEDEFYKVYSEIFQKIIIEEEKYRQNSEEYIETRESYLQSPILGNKNTDLEQVEKFYNYWNNFVSCQNFAWADLWDEREGENRREKRFIQKTNQIERKKAKRKYLNQIERLVQFVKNRDSRYEKLMLIMKEKKIQEQKIQEELKIKQEKEWQEKKEKLLQEELLKYEQERQDRGEQDDYLEVEYEDDQIFACKICDKEFKSENQLNNHNKSKQHLKNKKKLMKEVVMMDEKEKVQELEEEIQEISNKNKKKKKKQKKQPVNFMQSFNNMEKIDEQLEKEEQIQKEKQLQEQLEEKQKKKELKKEKKKEKKEKKQSKDLICKICKFGAASKTKLHHHLKDVHNFSQLIKINQSNQFQQILL